MIIGVQLVPGSVAKNREILQRGLAGSFVLGKSFVSGSLRRVYALTRDSMAVATGQSRSHVRLLPGRNSRAIMEIGVGYERTPNEQELKIESGLLKPHRSEEEHRQGPRGCSSGKFGWGDPTEQENVLEGYAGKLTANPNAKTKPLARSIVTICGDVVDAAGARKFRKGSNNVYGCSEIGGARSAKLTRGLVTALRRGVASSR